MSKKLVGFPEPIDNKGYFQKKTIGYKRNRESLIFELEQTVKKYRHSLDESDLLFCLRMVGHTVKEGKLED